MSGSHVELRPVQDDEWPVVAWLWQAFRNDLGGVVHSYPRPDGRYNADQLAGFPAEGRAGYLAWTPHPQVEGESPVAFALVSGLAGARRSLDALWTAPVTRRTGLGLRLALEVVALHPGPWTVAFQHDNPEAGHFWRRVATEAFGAEGQGWTEEQRPVPHKPDAPPDHWIESVR